MTAHSAPAPSSFAPSEPQARSRTRFQLSTEPRPRYHPYLFPDSSRNYHFSCAPTFALALPAGIFERQAPRRRATAYGITRTTAALIGRTTKFAVRQHNSRRGV